MIRRPMIATATVALAMTMVSAGELGVKPSAAVQVTRESSRMNGNFVNSGFVRGEAAFSGKTDKGSSGLLQLRFESILSDPKDVSLTVRQCYWEMPVSKLGVRLGRWYESYTPGAYFGRFLYGVGSITQTQASSKTVIEHSVENDSVVHTTKSETVSKKVSVGHGSGSMKTDYTQLDGLRLKYSLAPEGVLDIHGGLLTSDSRFEKISAMLGLTSSIGEALSIGLWGNFGVNVPAGEERVHRLAFTAGYSIIENLKPFVEVGITDLSDAGENTWVVGGLTVPTAKILDHLRFECEFKSDRFQQTAIADTDNPDFAWMIIMSKKLAGVAFDLNIGSDPKSLKTLKAGEIGAHLRMTVKM